MATTKVTKYYATGKRKSSIARVWIIPGDGIITVNEKPADEYFKRETLRMIIRQPFDITETRGDYDVIVNINGGGLSGQAGAVKHGISKALLKVRPELRSSLKKAGLLTRDSRIVERKKYGKAKARKRFQFSKR